MGREEKVARIGQGESMIAKTLKLAGKEFVILSKRDYATLKDRASKWTAANSKRTHKMTIRDRADVAEAKRILADPSEKFIPWKEVRKRMG